MRPLLYALVSGVLMSGCHAYSLNRAAPYTGPEASGFACIPVPLSRVVAPGQKSVMHIYDSSSLQVLRHAKAFSNSTYGQVVIDDEAMAERRFALLDVGSRVKILSMTPSTHTDKFGGTSSSMMCEVMGIGVISPDAVLEKMPFMTIECSDDDTILQVPESELDVEMWASKLEEAANLCETLDEVASFKGELTQAAARGVVGKESSGPWSLSACTDQLLSLRGCPEPSDGSRLLVSALAATCHLPGEKRYEAMQLAQAGNVVQTVDLVATALEEEARRRLAMKALAGVSSA